jgi:hypothetical protein
LVVEKAELLLTGAYVRQLQEHNGTQVGYSWQRQDPDTTSGPLTVNQTRPDDTATRDLVLTLRFFILKNETASFRWLGNHVLNDPGLSDEWKQGFTNVRNDLNAFLAKKSPYKEQVVVPDPQGAPDKKQVVEEHHWTYGEIMDTILNGGLAHAEPSKREIYERWRSHILFPFVQFEFDHTIMVLLRAIAYVDFLSGQDLAGPEAPSPKEAPVGVELNGRGGLRPVLLALAGKMPALTGDVGRHCWCYFDVQTFGGGVGVSGNRRRHPANALAENDQQHGLCACLAPDRQHERESDCPGNAGAEAVGPIVSQLRHS